MSLKPTLIPEVPVQTQQVAQACFPKGNIYMAISQQLGAIFNDETFVDLYPRKGQPALSPWRLALVTIMQFMEGLSDREAVQAIAARIDWKYALRMELTETGFDHSVLSEFRDRLIRGGAEELLLDELIAKCKEKKWLKSRGIGRTDSTHVLGCIRAINRLVCAGETLRAALNSLAEVAPAWLGQYAKQVWVKRYSTRMGSKILPKSKEKKLLLALQIGKDGHHLLSAIDLQESKYDWLKHLPAVAHLRQVWIQQYYIQDNQISYRNHETGIPPAAQFISSPYDTQARYAKKFTTSWIGYKVHLTESCEQELPFLITNVLTSSSSVADNKLTESIHHSLKKKERLPGIHLVDTGYIDASLLVSIPRDFGVDLFGPTRADYKWQAMGATGFAMENFQIDLLKKQAICPEGKRSKSWSPALNNKKKEVIKIKFSNLDCQVCKRKKDCTNSTRRSITIHNPLEYTALVTARKREKTEDYANLYKKRAGIEGTISQGVRAFGLRKARYVGLAKTHLQHVITTTAINFSRIYDWIEEVPRAKTRVSTFEKLMCAIHYKAA